MTTRELLAAATATLKEAGCDTPRLDVELLLMHIWHIDRTGLIMRMPDAVPEEVQQRLTPLLERRCRREPLAYITGLREFWSREFTVTPDVLIPRPETEHLIEELMRLYPDSHAALHFCDIGTGSGCIAITLACEYPHARIVATDISDAALEVARANAVKHGVASRIDFFQGDMLAALPPAAGPFDAILSNPPYVAEAEMAGLAPELAHEPRHALTDCRDGLHFLQQLADESASHLLPGGHLIVETGPCGLPAATGRMQLLHSYSDLAGHLRGGVYKAAI
jgi:release factor glutamine methyltransferase